MQDSTSAAGGQSAYFGLYSLRLRAALGAFDDNMLRVFIALGTYIDAEGQCWPGIKEIARVTGLRFEAVSAALEALDSAGLICFVRRNERDPVTKRQVPNVYALSSALVKVNQGFDRASDRSRFRSHGENLHNQNHMLEQESTTRITEPTSVTNVSNQPPSNAAVTGDPTSNPTRHSTEGQPQGQTPAAIWSDYQQWHSHETGAHAPHITPPTPPSLPMRAEMIERMKRAAPGLSGRTAGTLIDRNGIKACVTALTELEAQTGKVDKPAAWLVTMCYKLGDYERRRAVAQAGD